MPIRTRDPQIRTRDPGPGYTAEDPLQEGHPDVGFMDRFRIKFRGGGQEAGQRLLEKKGFEAQPLGGSQYALRRPGETQWRLLDDPGAEWQDVTDIAGDVGSLAATIGGGIAGAAGGPASGVGGAALGSAGAGAFRQLLSGLPAETVGEALGEIGEEAVSGAVTQVGGQLLGGAARGLRGLSRAGRLGGARAEHLARSGRKFGEGRWRRERMRGEGGKFRQEFEYFPPETGATTGLGRRLAGAGRKLEAPGQMLQGITGSMAGRFLRSPVGAAGGFAFGGPLGTAVGVSGLMGATGRGLGRISRTLMKDTSGRPLLFLLNRAGQKVGARIERALKLAGNPSTKMAYRAAIFQLLHDPEFRRLLRPEGEVEE